MATFFPVTNAAWTPIATSGNPFVRVRGEGAPVRIHIGAAAPALATADFVTLENGRAPFNFGPLMGGRRMWARAAEAPSSIELDDAGFGPENVSRIASAAASINATLVKNTPGRVHRVLGRNAAAAVRSLKIYNKAASIPAPAGDTSLLLLNIPLAPGANFNESLGEDGLLCSTGIGFAITAAMADADATVLAAGDIIGFNLLWS